MYFCGLYDPHSDMFYSNSYHLHEYADNLKDFEAKILKAAADKLAGMVGDELFPMELSEFDARRYNDLLTMMKGYKTRQEAKMRIAHGELDIAPYNGRIDHEYIYDLDILNAMNDFDAVVSRVVDRYVKKNAMFINYHIEYERYMHSVILDMLADMPDDVKCMRRIYKAIESIDAKRFTAVIGNENGRMTCKIDKNCLMFNRDAVVPLWSVITARMKEDFDKIFDYSEIQPEEVISLSFRGKTIYEKNF